MACLDSPSSQNPPDLCMMLPHLQRLQMTSPVTIVHFKWLTFIDDTEAPSITASPSVRMGSHRVLHIMFQDYNRIREEGCTNDPKWFNLLHFPKKTFWGVTRWVYLWCFSGCLADHDVARFGLKCLLLKLKKDFRAYLTMIQVLFNSGTTQVTVK